MPPNSQPTPWASRSELQNTASVTNTLASRDALISDLIGNLNEVLETVDGRRDEVGQLIDALDVVLTRFDEQDTEILIAAEKIDQFAREARALGLGVMLGCMVESGIGIAAGCVVAPLCDHVRALPPWGPPRRGGAGVTPRRQPRHGPLRRCPVRL